MTQREKTCRDSPSGDPDEQAELFTAAYRLLSPSVLGYLRARGVEDPEAVTQDVFLALYTRISSGAEPSDHGPPKRRGVTGGLDGAKALVFTIAHSRAVDFYRRRERTPALVPHEPEIDPRTTTASAEDLALSGAGVVGLLDGLTEDHREVLLLRVVADLSIEQTADIMDRTPGAIKQLQRRALDALRNTALLAEQSTS
ncbi:RNA polymerase sigma factor [Sinomonas sp. ASV322]|uniref:RNA polymerase sigma factor n=1 Tax=Sinomonas sp. ASV322 TaxID=3041920 RepID=UPI0027DCDA46|nr:RNA polymerase sigma factor [Sinomonas sp. ASV322]MDQ4503050.1 RNA polymerase sigma factor [Sinomonas sp. ASV322]